MTDPAHLTEVRRFYDDLAPDYDLMTGFEARLGRDAPLFGEIVRRFGLVRALDAGCGTGFHSVRLARAGVAVTAVDVSEEMVRRARENASRSGVTIRVVRSSLTEPDGLVRPDGAESFDAVFCLGNTLAHMADGRDLTATLENFRGVLREGGTLFVQLLNYERILAGRPELLSARKAGNTTFERKYAYGEEEIIFTVSMSAPGHNRSASVTLHPLTRPALVGALRDSGYRDISWYGDLSFSPYDRDGSTDLVVTAVR